MFCVPKKFRKTPKKPEANSEKIPIDAEKYFKKCHEKSLKNIANEAQRIPVNP